VRCTVASGGLGLGIPVIAHRNLLRKIKIYRHSTWTSSARPSVASTLTLIQRSRVHQNTSFSFRKLKNFLGSGHSPFPRPHLSGRGSRRGDLCRTDSYLVPTAPRPSRLRPTHGIAGFAATVSGVFKILVRGHGLSRSTHAPLPKF